MTDPLTAQSIFTFIGFIVMMAGAVGGLWWKIHNRITLVEKDAYKKIDDLQRQISRGNTEFARMESRVASHGEMFSRIERALDRIEKNMSAKADK